MRIKKNEAIIRPEVFAPVREGLDISEHGSHAYEFQQDVFKGLSGKNDTFAQRLTSLGTNTTVQEKQT